MARASSGTCRNGWYVCVYDKFATGGGGGAIGGDGCGYRTGGDGAAPYSGA
jgi:hypothetical protein